MKKNLYISASIDQPELLENMVEKLACRRVDAGYAESGNTGSWKLVDTSSVEKYISGSVDFDLGAQGLIKMPYITCLLFSCIKEINDPYRLNWSMSLS
jgi:hypothetical protein